MKTVLLISKPLARDSSLFYLDGLPNNIEPIVVPKLNSVKLIREWIKEHVDINTEVILSSVAQVTKALTDKNSVQAQGYVLDTSYPFKLISVPSYEQKFHAPDKVIPAMSRAKDTYLSWLNGSYNVPGTNIIHSAIYVYTPDLNGVESFLEHLKQYPVLTCDIETFSLKHYSAGLGSIAFAWDKHNGGAIYVDNNPKILAMLYQFFLDYQGKLMFHNISFDCYVLIYVLYMNHLLDQEGLLKGLQVMLRNWDCTQLITYLATNSCSGNHLSIKEQAQEFAGDYALTDIEDITKIAPNDLLEYNLVDALSTWYVYEKHWNTVVKDNQVNVYENLFKPATVDVIQMQLTGAPINLIRAMEVSVELNEAEYQLNQSIQTHPVIREFTYWLNEQWVLYKNSTLKKKRVTIADGKEVFNPNSDVQLGKLINYLELPILDTTDSGAIATGKGIIRGYLNHTESQEVKDLFTAIADLKDVQKITSSFVPALLQAQYARNGWWYLFGNFRLGGTVSGRLSGNSPNLTQIPSGSKYGKLIKSCFQSAPGTLFVGLDFNSLEARINALLTKDPEKMKVYSEGYDSHCLNTYTYWAEKMPDIQLAEKGDECFRLVDKESNKVFYLKGDEEVKYKGAVVTVSELRYLLTNKGI